MVIERPAQPEALDFDVVLAAATAQHPWASRELWRRYSSHVASYARSRGSADPDDITSEVFLTVFSSLRGFQGGEAQFRSYLFTLTHRRLVDELRKRSVRGVMSEWNAATDGRSVPSAEDDAIRARGNADALTLIATLPEAQREVLLLRIVGDLTVEQVSDIVGRRAGAVKALQRRGLETLRKKMA